MFPLKNILFVYIYETLSLSQNVDINHLIYVYLSTLQSMVNLIGNIISRQPISILCAVE